MSSLSQMHSRTRRRSGAALRSARRGFLAAMLLGLTGCESIPELGEVFTMPTSERALSLATIASGLREALQVGSERAVSNLGRKDGFLNSVFHIPLPDSLRQAQEVSERFGMGGIFEEMEVQLNRAAEAAVPQAKDLFVEAIRRLTFEDVMAIYRGPDDAATRHLERTTAATLRSQMRPIVDDSLSEVGALNTFRTLAEQYNRLPMVAPINADLTSHVLDHASTALFTQVAKEEAAIRKDPAKRTTELLREVFGGISAPS